MFADPSPLSLCTSFMVVMPQIQIIKLPKVEVLVKEYLQRMDSWTYLQWPGSRIAGLQIGLEPTPLLGYAVDCPQQLPQSRSIAQVSFESCEDYDHQLLSENSKLALGKH